MQVFGLLLHGCSCKTSHGKSYDEKLSLFSREIGKLAEKQRILSDFELKLGVCENHEHF